MARKTHFKPGQRGLHFSKGKLYQFAAHHALVIRPWPQPMAWLKRHSHGWRPTRKFANLLLQNDILLGTKEVPPEPPPLMPYEPGPAVSPEAMERWYQWGIYKEAVTGKAFSGCIPEDVRAETLRYKTRRMSVLSTLARCPGALDLSRSNPALFLALANNWVFHRPAVTWPMRSVRQLVTRKQCVALAWLGFPATETVRRTLAKIVPDGVGVTDLLYLRSALRDEPESLLLLRHLPTITKYGLQLVTSARLRPHLTPRLVQDANAFIQILAADGRPANGQVPLQVLFDTVRMCEAVEWQRCPTVFTSLEAVRHLHDELIPHVNEIMDKRQYNLTQILPPPPFPGTRTITPLTTVRDLIREGREQKNCVAVYADAVAEGRIYIYRVEAPVRGTLSLKRTSSGWTPDEFALSCNQPVPKETYWPVIRDLLQSMAEKPKRPSRQEELEFSPYFQPLLFDEDAEVDLT